MLRGTFEIRILDMLAPMLSKNWPVLVLQQLVVGPVALVRVLVGIVGQIELSVGNRGPVDRRVAGNTGFVAVTVTRLTVSIMTTSVFGSHRPVFGDDKIVFASRRAESSIC